MHIPGLILDTSGWGTIVGRSQGMRYRAVADAERSGQWDALEQEVQAHPISQSTSFTCISMSLTTDILALWGGAGAGGPLPAIWGIGASMLKSISKATVPFTNDLLATSK